MQAKWIPCTLCVMLLALAAGAAAQEQADQNRPVLQTRPHDGSTPAQSQPSASVYQPASVPAGPPDAIPEGRRFIIKLKDTLDTRDLAQGKHFKAELREDLVTPSGLIVPKGRTIKGHVATYERGYTGARLRLALDEMET